MQYIFFLSLLFTLSFSDIFSMDSFEADFRQTITNEKGNTLAYSGHIKAMEPQYALWKYLQPSIKLIYINKNLATIIEPDLEQAITKRLHSNIDFFKIIKNATKVDENKYITKFQSINYAITIQKSKIMSITYKDQLDNTVRIDFTNHIINGAMSMKEFIPSIPIEYDLIKG